MGSQRAGHDLVTEQQHELPDKRSQVSLYFTLFLLLLLWVQSLDQEDPLEKEMAIHSSILAWRIPWTEKTWRATVHRITTQTRLKRFHTHYSSPLDVNKLDISGHWT